MRYTQKMVLSLILISFLLSGCSQHMPALDSSTAFAPPASTAGQTPQEESPTEDVQNLREMQLVMLFQALIRMDRHASLTITSKQAQALLPLVRKSMDEGSMNDSERKQVLGDFTPEQKTFLDEQFKQVNKHMKERMDNLGDELSPEEREKRVEAFIQIRKTDRQVEAGMIEIANGENQPLDPRSMGISVEQQLIELLVSKHD